MNYYDILKIKKDASQEDIKTWKRKCSSCRKLLVYSSHKTWKYANNLNKKCQSCAQKEDIPRKPFEKRFWEKVNKSGPIPKHIPNLNRCWVWTAHVDKGGYGCFDKKLMSHRVSYSLNIGPIPTGKCVLHKCDNPSCVNPSHLFIGTNADNTKDRNAKGRGSCGFGENQGSHKLTNEQVRFIKSYPKYKGSGIELANKFKVTNTLISWIRKNKGWKHITI